MSNEPLKRLEIDAMKCEYNGTEIHMNISIYIGIKTVWGITVLLSSEIFHKQNYAVSGHG